MPYKSFGLESELLKNEHPLSYVEGKRSKHFATETSSPTINVEPIEELKEKSLSAMRQHAAKQIDQLQQQANLLVQQARHIENRVELAEKIGKARFGFKPVLLRPYFLYSIHENIEISLNSENPKEKLTLSLVAPYEWNEICPYGELLAVVRQLGDSTWELIGNDEIF